MAPTNCNSLRVVKLSSILVLLIGASTAMILQQNQEQRTKYVTENSDISTLFNHKKNLLAIRDSTTKMCYLKHLPKTFDSDTKIFISDLDINNGYRKLSDLQAWIFAGREIFEFCQPYKYYRIINFNRTNRKFNLNEISSRRKKRNTKYRGQTQSQFLSFGADTDGKAEAESTKDGTRAVVTGTGIGQAQSQSEAKGSCDDCFGSQAQRLGEGRQPGVQGGRYPPGRDGQYPSRTDGGESQYPSGTTGRDQYPITGIIDRDRQYSPGTSDRGQYPIRTPGRDENLPFGGAGRDGQFSRDRDDRFTTGVGGKDNQYNLRPSDRDQRLPSGGIERGGEYPTGTGEQGGQYPLRPSDRDGSVSPGEIGRGGQYPTGTGEQGGQYPLRPSDRDGSASPGGIGRGGQYPAGTGEQGGQYPLRPSDRDGSASPGGIGRGGQYPTGTGEQGGQYPLRPSDRDGSASPGGIGRGGQYPTGTGEQGGQYPLRPSDRDGSASPGGIGRGGQYPTGTGEQGGQYPLRPSDRDGSASPGGIGRGGQYPTGTGEQGGQYPVRPSDRDGTLSPGGLGRDHLYPSGGREQDNQYSKTPLDRDGRIPSGVGERDRQYPTQTFDRDGTIPQNGQYPVGPLDRDGRGPGEAERGSQYPSRVVDHGKDGGRDGTIPVGGYNIPGGSVEQIDRVPISTRPDGRPTISGQDYYSQTGHHNILPGTVGRDGYYVHGTDFSQSGTEGKHVAGKESTFTVSGVFSGEGKIYSGHPGGIQTSVTDKLISVKPGGRGESTSIYESQHGPGGLSPAGTFDRHGPTGVDTSQGAGRTYDRQYEGGRPSGLPSGTLYPDQRLGYPSQYDKTTGLIPSSGRQDTSGGSGTYIRPGEEISGGRKPSSVYNGQGQISLTQDRYPSTDRGQYDDRGQIRHGDQINYPGSSTYDTQDRDHQRPVSGSLTRPTGTDQSYSKPSGTYDSSAKGRPYTYDQGRDFQTTGPEQSYDRFGDGQYTSGPRGRDDQYSGQTLGRDGQYTPETPRSQGQYPGGTTGRDDRYSSGISGRDERYPSGTRDGQYPSGTSGRDSQYPGGVTGRDSQYSPGTSGRDDQYPGGTTGRDGQYPSETSGRGSQYPSVIAGHDRQYPLGTLGRDDQYPGGTTGREGQYPSGQLGRDGQYSGGTVGRDGQYPSGPLGRDGQYSGGTVGRDSQYPSGPLGRDDQYSSGPGFNTQYAPENLGRDRQYSPGTGVPSNGREIYGARVDSVAPSSRERQSGIFDDANLDQIGTRTTVQWPSGRGTETGIDAPKGHEDDADSLAESSVQQTANGTQSSATASGTFGGGTAQAQVSGTYTGSGSFSAQAGTSDNNKAAQTQVSGGKHGGSSSAQGRGGKGQSQTQVQLNSETGATSSNAQSSGNNHGTNTQVQAGGKGGMADAQASGLGSTSSQAQIGFQPYQESLKKEHDKLSTIFQGGGTSSAQSGTYNGQSQAQLTGNFKYGISYTGAAQAGSGTKESVEKARKQLRPTTLIGFENTTIDDFTGFSAAKPEKSDSPLQPDTNDEETLRESESKFNSQSTKSGSDTVLAPEVEDDEANVTPPYDDGEDDYDYEEDYEAGSAALTGPTHLATKKANEIKQSSSRQSQSISLGPLENLDAHVIQDSSLLKEGTIIHPGQAIPGTDGYKIPAGFRGRVTSISNSDDAIAIGEESQAQSIKLIPGGTGKIVYNKPAVSLRNLSPLKTSPTPYTTSYINRPDSFVTVTKSVSGDYDPTSKARGIEPKKYTHTYYTKSSTCGYFTFSCNIVYGTNGRTKICRPKTPTNPDGTRMNC